MFQQFRGVVLACALLMLDAHTSDGQEIIDLQSSNNTYDYIVVCPPELVQEAQHLVQLRTTAGLRAGYVTTTAIAATFGAGVLSDIALQACISVAATTWRIAPYYCALLGDWRMTGAGHGTEGLAQVPTHIINNEGVDSWFTGYPVQHPSVRLGRISASTSSVAESFVNKLTTYRQQELTSAGSKKLLYLVGDLYSGNEGMAGYVAALENDPSSSWTLGSVQTIHARSYPEIQWNDYSQSHAAFRSALDSGVGIVEAFGQNSNGAYLVQMLNCVVPNSVGPTLTNARWPLLLGGTCNPCGFMGYRSCGDDLLFTSGGTIGVIGASGSVYDFDSSRFNRSLRQAIKRGVRDLGQIMVCAQAAYRNEHIGSQASGQLYTLLGDPATQLRLWSPPGPSGLFEPLGGEIEEEFLVQASTLAVSNGFQDLGWRCANTALGTPVGGSRFIRAAGFDIGNGVGDFIDWKLLSRPKLIQRNDILGMWIRRVAIPAAGECMVRARTDQGWVAAAITDQYGVSLDPAHRPGGQMGGWTFYYADLSALAGHTLQDIDLSYAGGATASGSVVCDVDDVTVTSLGGNEVYNGGFEDDANNDSHPDGWEGPITGGWFLGENGEGRQGRCLKIENCASDVSQNLDCDNTYASLTASFAARGGSGSWLLVTVRDVATGAVLAQDLMAVSGVWAERSVGFSNPAWQAAGSAIVQIGYRVVCGSGSISVDDVGVGPTGVTDVIAGNGLGQTQILLRENPVRNSRLLLRVPAGVKEQCDVCLYDVSGRRVFQQFVLGPRQAGSDVEIALVDRTHRGIAGVYFMAVTIDGVPRASQKVVVGK